MVCGNQAYIDAAKKVEQLPPPIRGIWSVDDFQLDNVSRPPLVTDTERWRHVIFDAPKVLTIESMNGAQKRYYMELDVKKKSFNLWDSDHPEWNATFTFDDSQPDRMTLTGEFGNQSVTANLKRTDMSDPEEFLLINRGFHWIDEYPHQTPLVP